MVEPSNDLQEVFEAALSLAKAQRHEYLTVEHLLYALLEYPAFSKLITEFGADNEALKNEVVNYLATSIEPVVELGAVKPRKTQAVERVLNRAFTQVLFSGRQEIDLPDVFLSLMSEKKSQAAYLLQQANIDKEKFTDFLEEEQQRGITIQSAATTCPWTRNGINYTINLIDTPGHVDFSYEVSRSLSACEGALLVVDASQGVEAQTVANCYTALDLGVEVLPVLNKMDQIGRAHV